MNTAAAYGKAVSIDIDFDGNIWVSNEEGLVYKQDNSSTTWALVESADNVEEI